MCRDLHILRTPKSAVAPVPSIPARPCRYSPPIRTRAGTERIDSLTSKQRAHLRSLAHSLKPVIHVGTDGVTEAVIQSIEEAFNTRELLKIKVHDNAPMDVEQAAAAIAASVTDAHVPQTIGRTIVLYRPFDDEPEIRLPD